MQCSNAVHSVFIINLHISIPIYSDCEIKHIWIKFVYFVYAPLHRSWLFLSYFVSFLYFLVLISTIFCAFCSTCSRSCDVMLASMRGRPAPCRKKSFFSRWLQSSMYLLWLCMILIFILSAISFFLFFSCVKLLF